jgi:hypothetical protein
MTIQLSDPQIAVLPLPSPDQIGASTRSPLP